MVTSIIVSFAIGAMTFCGQQYGKRQEWKRVEAKRQNQDAIQMMKDLCEKKDICGPEVNYLNSKLQSQPDEEK